ncbi:hypothetical protein G4V39_11035 [Thermosulfuriphilus ammonigenes]|uniref:Uncharacterized protein n=1 Tax=Thermosulfuriphilus ammonigenes TaxID=1936021 RepID=A0A6G7PZA7_9BACT|nr:hypothetical protein [Thermosulfuriphilus ammonigenes]MBA2849097.1 glucokinase [Thermosulfuriphilus ammonigenes]QIJ72778.1 hypothetical protein G4V39_11035 [Thermosulfuriphilus ammonigenes]
MQKIPISLAREGMILAKEVTDSAGRVLCGPGTELSQRLLDRLANMGVQFVVVEGHPVAMPGEKSLEERLAELERRFEKVAGDPVLAMLKEVIQETMMEKG